ncbi:RidA family protein [Luteipulveratus halotolerans]|uniref:Endoribonuclease n=1 Tax=Luteipulveratus halotolerans TaxID=1631356 RepID=A0A0L6CDG8_9MICO|nr:RidA family protein [Luteipulveratus halotolerans]KNX35857.1 endoribonuclease [Luteipulveratus halotolerans]
MSVQLINPVSLPEVPIYRQVAVASGSRTVYVAGQIARDAEGNPVGGGDLAMQVERAYLNLGIALQTAGATFDDLVKVIVYFVDWSPEKMNGFLEGLQRAAEALGIEIPLPPLTGIGVAALAEPDVLVEVEGIAVIE